MARPILYSFHASSCSWRVRITLAYKGIDYDIKTINLPKGESHQPEYLKINPMGQVPALVVGKIPICDSMAIMEYLDEAHPEKPLMPKDLFKRAKVREICAIVSSAIQPLQNPSVAKKYSDDPTKQTEWTHFYINRGFKGLDKLLSESSGRYCVGNDLSIADFCLIPQVYNAETRFKVDMTPYPHILKVYKALMELDAVRSTHPMIQGKL